MVKVMVVAPHPDDAELSMGGTIARMIHIGWEVTVVDLTNGEPTPLGSVKIRKNETEKANTVLGIRRRVCLQMPNRHLRRTLENRRKLAEVIRLSHPDILFGPLAPDYHPDHNETAKLLSDARFEAKLCKTEMRGRPHWAGMLYHYYSTHRTFHDKPSLVVDITEFWDRKIEAINAYQSQIRRISPGNVAPLVEGIECICRYFGWCAGVKFGEPFFSSGPTLVKRLDLLAEFA